MTTRDAIHVTADLLEQLAFEKGVEITLRPTHAELRLGSHVFVSPLPLPNVGTVPAQRQAGEAS